MSLDSLPKELSALSPVDVTVSDEYRFTVNSFIDPVIENGRLHLSLLQLSSKFQFVIFCSKKGGKKEII